MNDGVEYKEFQSLQDFEKYLKKCNPYANTSYMREKTYWIQDDYGFYISFSYSYNNSIIVVSNIGTNSNYYFYIDEITNKVYTLFVNNFDNRIDVENKLYHLTHGPKAISIPDAFKVLSL